MDLTMRDASRKPKFTQKPRAIQKRKEPQSVKSTERGRRRLDGISNLEKRIRLRQGKGSKID